MIGIFIIFWRIKTLAKRKRNHSKRAKINSQGFKVRKGTRVYVGKETVGGFSRGGKPAPRKEIVKYCQDFFREDKDFIKMNKHIKEISIVFQSTNKYVGFWNDDRKKLTIIDDGLQTIQEFKSTLCHEVKGHTRWHLALKYRREELIAFNEFANKCDPVSTYVKDNEKKWRSYNDDNEEEKRIDVKWDEQQKIYGVYDVPIKICNEYQKMYDDLKEKQKTNGHDFMTRYANEQHSAIAEIVCAFGGHETLLNQKDVDKLLELYKRLHY